MAGVRTLTPNFSLQCVTSTKYTPCPSTNGVLDTLLFDNDISTTHPINGLVVTSGTGGNRTVGNGGNNFSTQHLRSLSPFVVGNLNSESEFQSVQTALNSTSPTPAGTFNIIYLQPGIQYIENITTPLGDVVIRGQTGAGIVGNITVPIGSNVFLIDLLVTGTVTVEGSAVFDGGIITNGAGGSAGIFDARNGVEINNTTFLNNSAVNPTITLLTNAGPLNMVGGIVQNDAIGGTGINMPDDYTSNAFITSSRFPGGDSKFTNNSTIVGNYFNFNLTNEVLLSINNYQNDANLLFNSNRVDGLLTLTKNNSNESSDIFCQGNTMTGATFAINITNMTITNPNIIQMHINGNMMETTSVVGTFSGISPIAAFIFKNNFVGGSSLSFTGQGNLVCVLMDNYMDNTFTSCTDVILYFSGNLLDYRDGIAVSDAPLRINNTSNGGFTNYLIRNWISTRGQPQNVIFGTLSNSGHQLRMYGNYLTTNVGTNVFDITLAGGSTFLTDGQNDNVNGSPVGTVPIMGALTLI